MNVSWDLTSINLSPTNSRDICTSCTLNFTNVKFEGIVTISKDEGRISGIFTEEVASAFKLPQELVQPPDDLLTFCSVCGIDGAGLPFSIT